MKKKIEKFLRENRAKIIIWTLLVVYTILKYFVFSEEAFQSVSECFFNNKIIFGIFCFFRFFILLFVSYEFCNLITNQKKSIAIVGTIMIIFSSIVQWRFLDAFVNTLIFGQLAIVLLNKFLISEKFLTRVLACLGTAISILFYIFTYNSPYMITFAYMFLAIAIWVIIKNRKICKIDLKDIVVILVLAIFIISICVKYLPVLTNTNYQIKNLKISGNGIGYLFSYTYNFLLPFIDIGQKASLTSIISIFPIPMIMAIYYIYKKEKYFDFLLPLSIVAVMETVFCISGFPEVISKMLLLENVMVEIAAVAVGLANFYLLLYMISNIEEEIVDIKTAIKIALATMCVMIFVPVPNVISGRGYLSLFSGFVCIFTFLFLNNYDKKYQKVLLFFLVLMTLISGVFVTPII